MGVVTVSTLLPFPAAALEINQTGHKLAIAIGVHDVIDQDPFTGVAAIEYRPCCRWKTLRPAIGSLVTFNGAWYTYGGIRTELESSKNPFLFSVNTAMGYYRQGQGTRLGHALEFRSGFETYYVFDNAAMLGITFHHLSNASIGSRNPGTEILSLVCVFSIDRNKSN